MSEAEKPRKTLSLKRPSAPVETEAAPTNPPSALSRRPAKRIIRREDLSGVQKAGTIKTPSPKPKAKKPTKPRRPAAPKKPAPSQLRLENINASLNAYPAWLHFKPLAIGIERQIFQHIAKHALSASKRVVQKLLFTHTRDARYQQQLAEGVARVNLDGTAAL